MIIIEELSQLSDQELAKKSGELFADCEGLQRRVLADILHTAQKTEFGLKNDFDQLTTAELFRRHMPLTTWTDYEAYSTRMQTGEADVTFPGKAQCFTLSSSTTSTRAKYIPDSTLQLVARKLVERMRQICYFMVEPHLLEGMLMPLVNAPTSETTETGIPVGNASGMTMLRSAIADKLAFPISVFQIADSDERDYQMMVSAIAHRNVYVLAGNNAGRMTSLVHLAQARREDIIRDIAQKDPARAEELKALKDFTPAGYWKDLKLGLFWLSASVGQYVDELRPLLPKTTRMMDVGYGASEAKFNIPLVPEDTAGVLSTATAFYEFIPEGGGEPLMAHQVEAGKTYELVVTTWGGLYRYNMNDMVRVTGFVGTTPKIEFLYKSVEILNMVDEKIPASVFCELIRQYYSDKLISIRQIQIYQDVKNRCYQCYIEPIAGHIETGEAADQQLDALVAKEFQAYRLFKVDLRLLNTLHVTEMKQGWQASLYAKAIKKTGMTNSQVKLSLIAKEPADKAWCDGEG